MGMNEVYDVQQLLKQFGIFIYTGDRLADLEFMGIELKELYELNLIEPEQYQVGILILKRESRLLQEKKKENR